MGATGASQEEAIIPDTLEVILFSVTIFNRRRLLMIS
jgi:hypothetical protein